MGTLDYEHQVTIRSIGKSVQALDTLVAALRGSGRLKFRGRKVTKEAVVNAVWLWLAELGPERMEQELAGPMARFEAMLTREPAPDEAPPAKLSSGWRPVAVRDETAMHVRDTGGNPGPKKGKRKAAPKGKGR